ncbi:proteasome subunit alpha [Nocardia sp. 852002-20019_SCH5090214]|uniref:Proteasome subunit alpha n=1 Tax=Nocardia nova TaxID=37330 RepID=A0A2S6A5G5_9NOCA|nr:MULTISPECIES: proteasome subunit alpha [Nocardia]OBF76658.1 proteasome subunit alpha [Mycobacterium sp. 852002-51759_SCH5129042]MBF6275388.1 proteasome subunit alpha [Nocardia nova]MBV7703155.1 proteasome subunit alpha [Nocardia nova]OBA40610.1 proteasome subunit alpha [Nocardia sp. 852002-20019_SCH5090214]OBA53898.1 proteasome subunit alpha [Nocardia sp. 852002-51101_SCH5132738]
MTLPYYASAEQIMRDKTELARKGIARGRSVVVLVYDKGVLFVAENPSATLHKVSELYDRIGFAAVGKYNEFESLRRGGILQADLRGYQYDRRDVTGRALANMYASTLGTIFTDQLKPYEVEICIGEVGYPEQESNSVLYRINFDGSIVDERDFVVMGGNTDPISTALKDTFQPGLELRAAIRTAVDALQKGSPDNSDKDKRGIAVSSLEVATLEQARPRRAFRRIPHAMLETLLSVDGAASADEENAEPETPSAGDPSNP